MLYVHITTPFDLAELLGAIVKPCSLTILDILAIDHLGLPIPIEYITLFVSLKDITLTGSSINAKFIDGLATFRGLTSLGLTTLCPNHHDLQLILRRTSLKSLELCIPASVQVGHKKRAFDSGY